MSISLSILMPMSTMVMHYNKVILLDNMSVILCNCNLSDKS